MAGIDAELKVRSWRKNERGDRLVAASRKGPEQWQQQREKPEC